MGVRATRLESGSEQDQTWPWLVSAEQKNFFGGACEVGPRVPPGGLRAVGWGAWVWAGGHGTSRVRNEAMHGEWRYWLRGDAIA